MKGTQISERKNVTASHYKIFLFEHVILVIFLILQIAFKWINYAKEEGNQLLS